MNLKTLRAIKSIIGPNRSKLPVLNCIHLESEYLYLSDLSITVKVRHYFPVINGPILVDTEMFLKRMSSIKAPFTISNTTELAESSVNSRSSIPYPRFSENVVCFQCPDYQNSFIQGQNPIDSFVSHLPKEPEEKVFSLTGGEIKIMNIARQFKADDELRPVMSTVCLSQEFIVASDAHKLYFRKIHRNKGEKDIMIDARVIRLMMLSGDDFDITIQNNKFYKAESPDMTIVWRKTDGNFPNWRSVIPKESLFNVTVPVKEMLEAIRSLEFAINPYAKQIRFELKDDYLVMIANNIDEGIRSTEKLNIVNTGKASISFGFKADFLKQIFKVFADEGRYQVSMKFSENNRCFIFADYVLLMPMMIHESDNF